MDPDFSWAAALAYLVKMAAAFALALPIAWDREHSAREMGLRTFPIVALASCGYVLVGASLVGETGDAHARLLQGLMTGIGFVGGGAILKEGATVRGTATAASVWTTGAIGAAVAYGLYEIAVVLSLANVVVLRLLTPFKSGTDGDG